MAAITSCPKCDKHVAVPDGVSADAEVRCPLCDEQFALSDSTTDVPSLIVLSAPAGDVPSADGAEADASEQTIDFGSFGDDIADQNNGDADSEAQGSGIDFGSFGVDDGDSEIGLADDADSEAQGSGIGFGDAAPAVSSLGGFGKSTDNGAEPEKKKSRKLGLVSQIVGFVAFGVVGICLGYIVLLWWKPHTLNKFHTSMPFLDYVAAAIGPADAVDLIKNLPPPPPVQKVAVNQNPTGLPDVSSALTADGLNADEVASNGAGTAASDPTYEREYVNLAVPDNSFASIYPAASLPSVSLEDLQDARKRVGNRIRAIRLAEKKAKDKTIKKSKRLKSLRTSRKKLFQALCNLAEISTFYAADMSEETDAELAQVMTMLDSAVSSRGSALKTYGRQWISYEKRKPEATGVLVVGRVTESSPEGGWIEIDLDISSPKSDEPQSLRILATSVTNVEVGQDVAVLGSIVEQSHVTLEGYDFDDPVIVLSRVIMPLPLE